MVRKVTELQIALTKKRDVQINDGKGKVSLIMRNKIIEEIIFPIELIEETNHTSKNLYKVE